MARLTKPNGFMLDGKFGVNVKDFGVPGMVGNGDPAYDTPAFAKALAALSAATDRRGGVLAIPAGLYRPSQTFATTNHELLTSIYVVGEGPLSTQVYGDAMPANSDIFRFGEGVHFGIEKLFLVNAKRNGLRIKGGNILGPGYSAQGYARELRIQGSGADGLYSENSYLCTFDDIWSRFNGACGYNFAGFHTSIKMGRLMASEHNNAPGFQCNSMIYSSMTDCASDFNLWGYSFTNIKGFAMTGCGSEFTKRESILLRASNALAVNSLQESADISAFVISGGYFMHGNNDNADGAYASFIGASAENSRKIDVTLVANASLKNPAHANDKTLVGSASAGSTVRFRGIGNNFDAPNLFSGDATFVAL